VTDVKFCFLFFFFTAEKAAMDQNTHVNARMGNCDNTRGECIRLLHYRQPVAHVHETFTSL